MAFWGHICKPGKRYEQEVETAFHVSQVCLELSKENKKGWTTLILETNGEDFILCHVDQNNPSKSVDLVFEIGEQICFRTEGPGTLHLSGYVQVDEDGDMMDFDESDDEEEVPELVNGKKRKNDDSLDSNVAKKSKNNSDEKKDAIKLAKQAASKIAKENPKISMEDIEFESDDDDDESVDMEEEDDDSGEEEEEDEEDSDEEEEEEDEEEVPMKKNQNGLSPQKKAEKANGMTPNKKAPKEAKTPNKDAKTPNKDAKTPNKDAKTPNKDAKTPNKDAKTPNKDAKTPNKDAKTPKKSLKGGIIVEDLKVGSGPEAKRGKMVGMYYKGRLASNGKQFDATTGGDPFKFKLGFGEVIKGWDLGLEGIKVGGKRKLTIPPKMGYGNEKSGPIPPNSTLVFEVECKFVK